MPGFIILGWILTQAEDFSLMQGKASFSDFLPTCCRLAMLHQTLLQEVLLNRVVEFVVENMRARGGAKFRTELKPLLSLQYTSQANT